MESLSEQALSCPYCGEQISVLIDSQELGNAYIEDCQVCCQPMVVGVGLGPSGDLQVTVHAENEAG